jgi:hypothetical protein
VKKAKPKRSKREHTSELKRLRSLVTKARKAGRALRAEARAAIARHRVKHRRWVVEEKARHRQRMNAARGKLRILTESLRANARVDAALLVDKARDELQAHRDEIANWRQYSRDRKRWNFSDMETELKHEIGTDRVLAEIYARHRSDIKKMVSPRMSLREAFAHYLHDNGQAVTEAHARLAIEDEGKVTREVNALTREWKRSQPTPVRKRIAATGEKPRKHKRAHKQESMSHLDTLPF